MEHPKPQVPKTSTLPKPNIPSQPMSPEEQLKLQEQLRTVQAELNKQRQVLKQFGNGHLLPDKGEKLKNKIKASEDTLEGLKAKLIGSKPASGSVVISDEEKLNLLHKKARTLKMHFSVTRPDRLPDGGAHLRKQIQDVEKEIIALEPIVKMRNPRYEAPKPPISTPLAERNMKRVVNLPQPK